MRNAPPIATDLFDQEIDRVYCLRLSEGVFVTQLAGLGLIVLGLGILRDLPRWQLWWAVSVFGIGMSVFAACMIYVWSDEVLTFLSEFTNYGEEPDSVPEAKRKTRILRATLILVVLDVFLLALLIPVTGGPGKSVLDPLLPTIPIIAIILKQPKRTVFVALGAGFLFVLLAVLHWLVDPFGLHGADLTNWIYYTHRDARHELAFGIVTGGAIGLSALELARYNRPEIGRGIRATIRPMIDRSVLGITWSIKKGTKNWIKWLDHRDLPLVDLSLVHSPDEVVKQAVILCIPYWQRPRGLYYKFFARKRIARHVTFLTFAAHWIDDHFDALNSYCHDPKRRSEIVRSTPNAILKEHYPRLDELLKRMKKLVSKKHRKQVEHAVVRIIYGGLIQNAPTEDRKKDLLNSYSAYVCRGKSDSIRGVYDRIMSSNCPMVAWATSKVVMELLDSCAREFSADESEFVNLLYAPILYYHNWNREVSQESFGKGFGDTVRVVQKNLPSDGDMVLLIDDCVSIQTQIFGEAGFPLERQNQLTVLLRLYGSRLPDSVQTAYSRLMPS